LQNLHIDFVILHVSSIPFFPFKRFPMYRWAYRSLNPYLDHTATQLFHKLAPLFLLHIFVYFAVAPSDDGGSEIVSYSLEVNSGQGNVYVLLR
jgi:hypothetical protein